MKRQLAEKATLEKDTEETERGYESTGSVITVINTKRSYAEVAKRDRKGTETRLTTPPPSAGSVVTTTLPSRLPSPPPTAKVRGVVMQELHSPTNQRRWIEEGNEGVTIMGIR